MKQVNIEFNFVHTHIMLFTKKNWDNNNGKTCIVIKFHSYQVYFLNSIDYDADPKIAISGKL